MKYDLKKLSFTAIMLFLIVLSIYNLFTLSQTLSWRYEFDYSESVVISTKINYLYKSFSTYPYMITYYTPLFYLIIGASNYLAHVNLPYFYERLYTLIATLASTVMIYFITKKLIKDKSSNLKIIAPLLFLSSYLVLEWGASFSPVMFELLFDLIAIYLLIDYKSRKNLVFAAIAMSIGFMFRQSALFMFVGIAAYLIVNRKFKDSAIFSLVFLVIIIPIIISINSATAGRFLFSTFVLPAITPFSLLYMIEQTITFSFESWFLVIFVFAAYWMIKNRSSLLSIALIASLVNVISSGKIGSANNYFIVFYALLCIAAVIGVEAASKSKHNNKMVIFARAMCIVAVPFMLHSYIVTPYAYYSTPYSYPFHISNASEVGISLRNVNGSILSEDPSVDIAANKSMQFEPSIFWVMKNKGIWNDSQILSDIKQKRFAVITYPESFNWFSVLYPEIINTTKEYYYLNRTSYGWYIYTPYNGSSSLVGR